MNSTEYNQSYLFCNNTIVIPIQSWFILINICLILFTVSTIILSIVFILIIVLDKICHTTPMMLVANTCIWTCICACARLGMVLFTLQNDLKQVEYEDSLCVFRAYMTYGSYWAFNYSFFLEALYRHILAVYPTRLFWQSLRIQILFICLFWIFCLLVPTPFLYPGAIIYDVNDQICHLPVAFSIFVAYALIVGFSIPVSLIIYLYIRLVRHIKQISKNVTTSNNQVRAQRQQIRCWIRSDLTGSDHLTKSDRIPGNGIALESD
ncbi:unnamed protein product [Adineta ricciae]|uniref:G-protein coupled receptors family 1 profile domain-containing protein n=1 Tax=Adineta ricciae TaxID=249248 RepID=A0A815S2L8_ADIRI|nr:unnamed protein product [Adineta ricciae]